jgi:hypothetical protein
MAKTVKLELTEDQAYTLRMVLDRVGGDPVKSRRKDINSISWQLIDQDVPYDISGKHIPNDVAIYFNNTLDN